MDPILRLDVVYRAGVKLQPEQVCAETAMATGDLGSVNWTRGIALPGRAPGQAPRGRHRGPDLQGSRYTLQLQYIQGYKPRVSHND